MPEIVDRLSARQFLLGDDFRPREENIPTPQLLLDKGFPAESLRLVGFPADKAKQLSDTSNGNQVLYVALCTCACLCWRADGQPVFNMADAPMLACERDYGLLNALAVPVKPFLGIGPAAVDNAKNDSEVQTKGAAGPKNVGGTASPNDSNFPPSEPASEPSNEQTS
ncbi:MAG TPA: hypothetical protein VGT44_23205 [Ktedonobacteraceae bacterium]|nr:hypothetical protein [Ktedonobacteraceae bacterium]